MARNTEIPVFMITGFLEAGKTTFLQEILENPEFNDGTKTLLLVCEEGEVEYNFKKFPNNKTFVETIENEGDLNPITLERMRQKCGAARVIVEYNGMWQIPSMVAALPEAWVIVQELTLADATTYVGYNQNMRQLVVDKLKNVDMVTFTHVTDQTDTLALHQIVRTVGRSIPIIYDFGGGRKEQDAYEDPLPYDMDADIVEIGDRDYGIMYADMMENLQNYDGKTIRFKSFIGREKSLPTISFFAGRHIMTCCANDIQFGGMICYYDDPAVKTLKTGDWAIVTAKIKIEKDRVYKNPGPVLRVVSLELCEAPIEEVVTYGG